MDEVSDPIDPITALATAHAKRMQEIADQGFSDTRQVCADAINTTKRFGGIKSLVLERALEKLGIVEASDQPA